MRGRTVGVNDLQIAPEFLKPGDWIQLKVGFNPKRGEPGFIPQFVYEDTLVTPRDVHFCDSVRVFIPSNKVELKVGEVWTVQVEASNVLPGLTRDDRRRVYINVKVLSRYERIEHDPDYVQMKLFVRRKSGVRVLEEKSVPIEIVPTKAYQDKQFGVVRTRLYSVAGKVIGIGFEKQFSRQDYVADLAKTIGRSASPASLAKVIGKLPVLPEIVDYRNIEL